jgi:hypothetical protein
VMLASIAAVSSDVSACCSGVSGIRLPPPTNRGYSRTGSRFFGLFLLSIGMRWPDA